MSIRVTSCLYSIVFVVSLFMVSIKPLVTNFRPPLVFRPIAYFCRSALGSTAPVVLTFLQGTKVGQMVLLAALGKGG